MAQNRKKGMAKRALSVSLVAAMLATSNTPAWASGFVNENEDGVQAFFDEISNEDTVLKETEKIDGVNSVSVAGEAISLSVAAGTNNTWYRIKVKGDEANVGIVGTSDAADTTISNATYTPAADDIGKTLTFSLESSTDSTSGSDGNWDAVGGSEIETKVVFSNNADDYLKTADITAPEAPTWATAGSITKESFVITGEDNLTDKGASITKKELVYNAALVGDATDVGKTITLKVTVDTGNPGLGTEGVIEVSSDAVAVGAVSASDLTLANTQWKANPADAAELARGKMPSYDFVKGASYYPTLTRFWIGDKEYVNGEQNVSVVMTYTKNDEPGAASVTATITAPGIAATSKVFPFTINSKNFEKTSVQWPASIVYGTDAYVTKQVIANTNVPGLVKKDGVAKNPDYEVIAPTSVTAGTKATVIVNGLGEYAGIIHKQDIDVTAFDLSKAVIDPIADQAYTGGEVKPAAGTDVVVRYEADGEVIPATDYTLEYAANKNAGVATVKVVPASGNTNYVNAAETTFKIVADTFDVEFTGLVDSAVASVTYSGKAQYPVDKNLGTYVYKNDFVTSYVNNVDAGTATVTVTGIGNYAGASYVKTFTIGQASLTGVKMTVADTPYHKGLETEGTTTAVKPEVIVTFNGVPVRKGIDYEVAYEAIAGTAGNRQIKATLTGTAANNSNFLETSTKSEFGKVISKDIKDVTIPSIPSQKYTGSAVTIDKLKLDDGSNFADGIKDDGEKLTTGDYTVSVYQNNVKPGTATMTIMGIGDYKGSVNVTFPIDNVDMNAAFYYTAESSTLAGVPAVEYSYEGATDPAGIKHAPADGLKVLLTETVGSLPAGTDVLTQKDSKGNPYCELVYTENKAVGTATIEAVGTEGYEIHAKTTFKITPKTIDTLSTPDKFEIPATDYFYTGEAITPKYTVSVVDGTTRKYALKEGVDYEVVFENNVNAETVTSATPATGEPIGKLIGKGNYVFGDAKNKGIPANFSIKKAVISNSNIIVKDVVYAGGLEVTPEITVMNPYSGKALIKDTDYTVSLTNGVEVGTATATIKLTSAAVKNYELGTAGKKDTMAVNFQILPKNLADCDAKVVDGKVVIKNGDVTVPAKEYTVVENEDGTFTATAVKDGNYVGSVTVSPVVAPEATQAKVASKTTSSVKVAWDAVEGAEGYTIWYHSEKDTANTRKIITGGDITSWTHKGLAAGTKYFYTVKAWVKDAEGKYVFGEETSYVRGTTMPMKAKIAKVTATNGMVKVALADAAAGAEKYSMCYSKSSDFASFKVGVRTSYTTRTFTNALTKGTYYVRVKSYRDLNGGKRIYGAWSNTVKVVVK